ncbi:hypothetical protein LCGC14_1919440, partial [marine sediment metagenome]
LNMSEINVQSQFDPFFLLNKSPGDVAQYFNKVANLDKIDLSRNKAQAIIRQLEGDLKAARLDLDRRTEDLKQYRELDTIEGIIVDIEGINRQLNKKYSQVQYMTEVVSDYQSLDKKKEKELLRIAEKQKDDEEFNPYDMDKMKEFLDLDLPVKELKETVNKYKAAQKKEIALANEPTKVDVIYADPPWKYDNQIKEWGPTSLHYENMPTDEICNLPISGRIGENAVLFLWTTNPMLPDAFQVLESWGFEYKTNIVWVKQELTRPGSGFYVRGRHELLIIATKGSMAPDDKHISPPIGSVLEASVREHSRKPEEVYDIIERLYPDRRYLELFARAEREGWEVFGDEVGKY